MMNEINIKEQFQKLELHTAGEVSYKVISLPDCQHKLGKSDEGYPKFFIRINESESKVNTIIRELLTVEYYQVCRLNSIESQAENTYAIITLRSLEWAFQSTFLDIVMLMLNNMQALPSRQELAVEVEKLITIFSAMENPPVKKMQGLFGELLIIECSNLPEQLVNAWHSSPNAKFDFALGIDKIEVKTTSSENRIHKFSLDQLNPSPNSRLLIASMTVRESGQGNGGKSIQNLLDSICSKVTGSEELLHLYEVIAKTLGHDITKLNSVFFDYTEAVDTLEYFRAQDIPHIDKKYVPAGVTEVKFSSDLTTVPTVFKLECYKDYINSPLFKSIM